MPRRRCAKGKDAGAGTIEYAAVLLLVSAIFGVVITSAIPGTISEGIRTAICRILGKSNCGVTPQAYPYEPQQDCWTDVTDRTVDGMVTVDTRIGSVRVARRVTMTTRRVLHPDGTVTWDVIVSPNIEAGVSTPGSISNSVIDPLAWAVLQGTAGKIYSFNASDYGGDEKKAKEAAQRYADKLWTDQAQNDALSAAEFANPVLKTLRHIGLNHVIKGAANWLMKATAPVTKHLPVLGDNIDRATKAPDRDINKPDQSFVEGGPSVGWNLDVSAIPGTLSFWSAGRGFVNAGVRYNYNSDKYYKNEYFKVNGETDAAFNLSTKILLPTAAEKAVSAGFNKYIARIEGLLSQKSGGPVAIPSATKASLKTIWPMAGLDIKGKAARMFMLSRDKQGNPTQLRTITETQWVFSWRALAGADQSLASGRQNVGVGFVQGSIAGRKYNTQSILDLDGPEHAENLKQARDFLTAMGLQALSNPAKAVSDFTNQSSEAKEFSAYVDQNGQTYQQIWDSDVTTFVGFGKTISGGKYIRVLPVYEPETNKLVGAQYKTPRGWKPWTHCQR